MDPAIAYAEWGREILAHTNDGLLGFEKVGGPGGTTPVPDLASAFPEISPDGLMYTFPLREGIRYSTGEPVRPEDFRYGLERALALSPTQRITSAPSSEPIGVTSRRRRDLRRRRDGRRIGDLPPVRSRR